MKHIKIILILSLLFLSVGASAKWSNTENAKITEVTSHVDRYIIQTSVTDSNCNGKFFWLVDSPTSKEILSIAMMAMAGQMDVSVVFNENITVCNWAGDEITHISVSR